MWSDSIDSWLLALRAAGRPESTIALRRYHLTRLARELDSCTPFAVTGGQLIEWFGSQTFGREYRRSWRSSIRSFYAWAHALGYVDVDPARALPSVQPAEPLPRPAPEEEYRHALACAAPRVRLMLRLAAELGLRRGEVARIHARDLERDLLGWTLVVHGKGERTRRLPVTDSLPAAIRLAASPSGWLFPGRENGHLSAHWVGKLVARALPNAWAMHSLRHRFATVAYSVDRDLIAVQKLLGHASVRKTQI